MAQKLNQAQQQAVDTIFGPLLVIAGPGTGKTELLARRAAEILQKTDTLPSNILCITFTDSGAANMRRRMLSIIGQDAYKIAVHTFHSFGTEIINQYAEHFFSGAEFHPADDLTQYEIMREIFENLPHSNPLSSKHDGNFVYLKDALKSISELKRSGLTSDELLQIINANELVLDDIEPDFIQILASGIKKNTAENLVPVAHKVAAIPERALPRLITPYQNVLSVSLAQAIDSAEQTGSTKPITAWKNKWFKNNEHKQPMFKDRAYHTKLRALANVYYLYTRRLESLGLFDYDDMIMNVVHAVETQPDLKADLQEKYQFIMVDEFQDTNLAQLRLLFNLTEDVEQPNIMAVGDDDQAIFSFQGATQDNITRFRKEYSQPTQIVLTENYRSDAKILASARSVIIQNQDRLENYISDISKQLNANTKPNSPHVQLTEFSSLAHEHSHIACQVRAQIDAGVQPSEIVIVARNHSELQELLPYLAEQKIETNYERRDDALAHELIVLLEKILIVTEAMVDANYTVADQLLIEVISHPAFNFETVDIWRLSLSAYKNREFLAEAMAANQKFQPFLQWLTQLAANSTNITIENLIDEIIGTPNQQDNVKNEQARDAFAKDAPEEFTSPIYAYFFSQNNLAQNPAAYLESLDAIRSIRDALRDHLADDENPELTDLLGFFQAHHELNQPITIVRHRANVQLNAVNVMTVHKSKGLEFDHVYIIGAVDNRWGEKARVRSSTIGYSANLQIAPAGDQVEERVRLFYVAMTRARISLHISYSTDEQTKPKLPASFLAGTDLTPQKMNPEMSLDEALTISTIEWHARHDVDSAKTLRDLLLPTLETYKLSATHLNNFLDITSGGPANFLRTNLLHFPQAKNASASYGTAIHAALNHAHLYCKVHKNQRPAEDILADFEKMLNEQRLPQSEQAIYLDRGIEALRTFLASSQAQFLPTDLTELRFANQGVHIGDAQLTGALDAVHVNPETKSLTVVDYKTGKPALSWKGTSEFEKIKLHKYRQQLMFYQLLIENSRDYSSYHFAGGILQFVEPTTSGGIIALDQQFTRDELNEFTQLIQAVWRRIIALDLPDTSIYEPTIKGILQFEQNLLDNK